MSRVIEVIASPKGEVTAQTKGYAGSACLAASQFLDALGVVTAEQKTTEFYVEQTQQQETRA
jgi:hypothetical protein